MVFRRASSHKVVICKRALFITTTVNNEKFVECILRTYSINVTCHTRDKRVFHSDTFKVELL